jgi:hypothetical protein
MYLCPWLQFPSHKVFSNDILQNLVEEINRYMFYLCCMIVKQQLQALIFGCPKEQMAFLP